MGHPSNDGPIGADSAGSDDQPAGDAVRLEQPAVACAGCGRVRGAADEPWTLEVTERGAVQTCTACTRADLRSIEARLNRDWW